MADTMLVIENHANGVTTLTLNRPQRHNAFNDELINLLTDELSRLEKTPTTKIIILAANGKNFSAGADLDWMKKMVSYSKDENVADALQLVQLLKTLRNISKPTIALAQGVTMGGGVGLLACCDIVIAERDASFCFSEAKLGLVPATIAPYIVSAIGARAARYYFLTAKTFSAEDAKDIGLVQEIIEGNLHTAGMTLATSILKNGPQALSTIKKLLTKLCPLDESILVETAKLIADVRVSGEAQEGVNAFFEKRKPAWSG